MIAVQVVGPNPQDPTRNGGVAKYMEYLDSLQLDRNEFSRDFLFTDICLLSRNRLQSVGRFLATLWISLKVLFSTANILHINATLSVGGGGRLLPLVLAGRIRRRSVLIQVHGGRWGTITRSFFGSMIWSIIFRIASRVVVFPGEQFEEFLKLNVVPAHKLISFRNFVPDADPSKTIKDEALRFLFLGRLIREKGIIEVIDAFIRFRKLNSEVDAELIVLGSGPLEEKVYDLSLKEPAIKLLGFRSGKKLEAEINRCNVFVLPSYAEAFPLSFLECGIKGLAPIVTDNSAIAFFFQEGDEYLGVKPKSVDSIYQRMTEMAMDIEKRATISNNIRCRILTDFCTKSVPVRMQYEELFRLLSTEK